MAHQTLEEYFEENFFVILPTGKVNFNWPSQSNADGYFAKINKNGLPFNTYNTTGLSIEVSGFREGDVVDGLVFPHINNNSYSTPYSLNPQSIPVTNFNEEFDFFALDETHSVVAFLEGGESFRMSGVKIDSVDIDTINTTSGVFGTGHYEGGSANIDYFILNPRQLHRHYLTDFSEPFLSGIYYEAIGDLESSRSAVSNFSFDFNNTLDSRNVELTLVAQDIYSGGVTGHFSLLNEPSRILGVNQSLSTSINNSTGIFNFFPIYSGSVNAISYELKTSGGTSLFSGYSDDPTQASGSFPFDQTGFLNVTPYDWFGSGETFVSSNPIFYSSENFIPSNQIKNFEITSNQSSFSVYADYIRNNSSGSYFELSVNSSSGILYPQENSYFSGQFNDFQNEYVFDYFSNRTGSHEDFYFNLNLYRSGSNILEDSSEEFSSSQLPQFTKTGVNFNYNKGITKVNFESTPKFNFTGVDILFRNFNDTLQTSPDVYSGFSKILSEDNVNLQVSLVESGNHSNVFDTLTFVTSGQEPSLNASKNLGEYLDGKNVFSFINNKTLIPIRSINVYRKKGFNILSGDFNSDFSGLLSFNDYKDHFHQNVPLDFYSDNAPQNISRSANYITTDYVGGSYITGYYQSGRHYFYRFEPINYFNVTGQISNNIINYFNQNTIGSNTESDLATTESTVSDATDNISNIQSNITTVESSVSSVQSGVSDISNNAFFITGSQVVSGDKHFSGKFILGNNQIPSSPTDTGISGQLSWDPSYFYICTGNNAWGRISFDEWTS